MTDLDIICYSDANSSVGFGHISRQLIILNELLKFNNDVRVAISGNYSPLALSFIKREKNHSIRVLDKSRENYKCQIAIIDTMFYPGEQRIDGQYISLVSQKAVKLIMIWDVDQIILPKEIGIYINHIPFAKVKKSNENQSAFIGLDYLPVPDRFFNTAKYTLNGNVLFVIGSTPSHNCISELFELIKKDFKGNVQIILSPSLPLEFVNELRKKFKEFDILQNVNDLVHYFNTASAIVTTYGNTTYQVLASKRPVFTLGLIDFQDYYGMKLEEEGYSTNLGHISDLNVEKIKMIQDKSYLKSAQAKLQEKFNRPTIGNVLKIIIENLN